MTEDTVNQEEYFSELPLPPELPMVKLDDQPTTMVNSRASSFANSPISNSADNFATTTSTFTQDSEKFANDFNDLSIAATNPDLASSAAPGNDSSPNFATANLFAKPGANNYSLSNTADNFANTTNSTNSTTFANYSTTSADQSSQWPDFDYASASVATPRRTRKIEKREFWLILATAFIAGVLTWLAGIALANWLIRPLFCASTDTASVCASSNSTAFVISLLIFGAISAAFLSLKRVWRGAFIAITTFISLSALWFLLSARNWWLAAILSALFAALLALFFALLASIKKFPLALILAILSVIGFWLLARL